MSHDNYYIKSISYNFKQELESYKQETIPDSV